MKAIVKQNATKGLWLKDVPKPEMGPHDVYIKIKKTAICGTDMHIYNWDEWAQSTVKTPQIIGHEFSGEVVKSGVYATKYKAGDRVSGEGHIVCGVCRNCRAGRENLCRYSVGVGVHRDGAFAEYLCIPEHNVFPLPKDIDDNVASIFDPFGNAVHTALSYNLVGEDVLITGAGTIGIMAALVAQKVGARKVAITDINPNRLYFAKQAGCQHVFDSSKNNLKSLMKDIGLQEGFDIGFEMSGSPKALNDMIEVMNHGGKIALLGISSVPFSIPFNDVVFKMLKIKGIYGREMFETWYKMVALIQGGVNIAPIITHQFKASQFQQAFDIMSSGDCGKVILNWE